MVVTRKTPHAPAPVASRTNSAQPIPRAKQPQQSSKQSSPAATSVTPAKHNHKNAKQKSKKGPGKKPPKGFFGKLVELVFRALIVFFTIYTVTICPSDTTLESPICRSMFKYRKHVIEPYLLPPLLKAYHHPQVQPFVQTAKPYIENIAHVTFPVIKSAHTQWNARVVPNWNKRVVPKWNKRVIPLWNQYVIPQTARLDPYRAQLNAYVTQAEQLYYQHVAGPAETITKAVETSTKAAKPYVVTAANGTYRAYQIGKPHFIRAMKWNKKAMDKAIVILGKYRRELVDPHLVKIWEKVRELSVSSPTPASTESSSTQEHVEQGETLASSPVVAEETASAVVTASTITPSAPPPTDEPAASAESVVEASLHTPVVLDEETIVESTPAPDMTEGFEFASSMAPSPEITPVEATDDASSVADSIHELSSASSVVSNSVHATPSVESVIEEISSSADSITNFEPAATPQEDDPLADFFAELGLDPDAPEPSEAEEEQDVQPEPEEEEDTEEKQEERRLAHLAAVAAKRKDIEGRHTYWETKLFALVEESIQALPATLLRMREEAAESLKDDQDVKESVNALEKNAEKYLKGVETYLAGLKNGAKKGDQKHVWDKVVEKVDDKFQQELGTLRGSVHDIYVAQVNTEIEEVQRLSAEIKSVSEEGQTSVGLDYVWLDDVKTTDWARYHKMAKASENFTRDAQEIQAGNHPLSPPNSFMVGLDELDSEVQDIVVGFETRLRRLKRNGERILGGIPVDNSPDEAVDETAASAPVAAIGAPPTEARSAQEDVDTDISASTLPIEDTTSPTDTEGATDASTVEPTISADASQPEVSILPIEPQPEENDQAPIFMEDLPGIAFLGRDADEIVQRLKNVAPEDVEANMQKILDAQGEKEDAHSNIAHVEL